LYERYKGGKEVEVECVDCDGKLLKSMDGKEVNGLGKEIIVKYFHYLKSNGWWVRYIF